MLIELLVHNNYSRSWFAQCSVQSAFFWFLNECNGLCIVQISKHALSNLSVPSDLKIVIRRRKMF